MNNVLNSLDYVTSVLLFYPIVLDIYCRKEPTTVNLTASSLALFVLTASWEFKVINCVMNNWRRDERKVKLDDYTKSMWKKTYFVYEFSICGEHENEIKALLLKSEHKETTYRAQNVLKFTYTPHLLFNSILI